MEEQQHSLASLFKQLGLPSSPGEIRQFIDAHRPLPEDVALHESRCWSKSQAAFLLENMQNDADWSAVIDALNVALREPRKP